jgi:hypothetical protein
VTEVAATMSLPEVRLILEEAARKESEQTLVALQNEALTAFAVWDKSAGRRLEKLAKYLQQQADYAEQSPPSRSELSGVFAAWGASVEDK